MAPYAEPAAAAIRGADALLIAAGAGIGADSGLATFRGKGGFWSEKQFMDLANPRAFVANPRAALGFYGYRLNTYRQTVPHAGFGILKSWADQMPHGHFIYTSNVDGHFEKAGFDPAKVVACHGTIHQWQCTVCTSPKLYPAPERVEVDKAFNWVGPLPLCACGAVLRPNILMFGDAMWNASPALAQDKLCNDWIQALPRKSKLVVVEIGAGTAIPSVRMFTAIWKAAGATMIRINVAEAYGADIQIAAPALEALTQIDEAMISTARTPRQSRSEVVAS